MIYYITISKSLLCRGVCLSEKTMDRDSFSVSISDCYKLLEMSIQAGGWEDTGEIWDCGNSQ